MKKLIISDKTFLKVRNKKIKHISHERSKRWDSLKRGDVILLVPFYGMDEEPIEIQRVEKIEKTIKIFLK